MKTYDEVLAEIPANVQRGIRFLNNLDKKNEAKVPWYKHINLTTLKLNDCHRCVLGQLYDNEETVDPFEDGPEALALYLEDAEPLGFYLFLEPPDKGYKALGNEWKKQITRLREEV